jgi:hypothetical protein
MIQEAPAKTATPAKRPLATQRNEKQDVQVTLLLLYHVSLLDFPISSWFSMLNGLLLYQKPAAKAKADERSEESSEEESSDEESDEEPPQKKMKVVLFSFCGSCHFCIVLF